MLDIKFFETYYVGFQKERFKNSETSRILGFATPDNGDSASKKRKETVDNWSDRNVPRQTFKNEPMHGFKIIDTVRRYSTDNKKFRIEDPRGFELEIDAGNLFDIITKHTIVQGTIMEPMLWGRQGPNNYLISSNSEEYKFHISGAKVNSLEAGMWFLNKAGNILYRFEGRLAYNLLGASVSSVDKDEEKYRYNYLSQRNRSDYSGVTTTVTTIVKRKQDKPVFVYTSYILDENGETVKNVPWNRKHLSPIQKADIIIRKSELKGLIPITVDQVKCDFAKGFILPLGVKLKEIDFGYGNNEPDDLPRTNYSVEMNLTAGNQTVPVLFKTKAESMEAQYTHEELLNYFKPMEYNSYRYGHSQNKLGTIKYQHQDIK